MEDYTLAKYNITPYIDELNLSSRAQKRAEAILAEAVQTRVTVRKKPESLIAAALYIACILEGERRTQEAIGQVIGVSASTIHASYQQLVNVLDIRRN